jgi:hypothetical protein
MRGKGRSRDHPNRVLSKMGGGAAKENVHSYYNGVTEGAVPWRETWDTCTAPFSATFRARVSATNH